MYRLRLYVSRFGNCLVPRNFQTDDGSRLGVWMQNIRAGRISLDEDR
ncbi:MAG: hypothetical protein EBQ56_03660, partial [Proteobacteria bacterium]|nr:hypothetical protein [Pseudomonadota bacterium]